METHAPKAVFLSYASQDAEAARRIAEALRPAGIEVWFDQEGGLEHGDEWDAKIRHQIKECVLFLPLISTNTQARLEGYFRIEWELAAERAMGIAHGVPFILPVVIDDTREPEALVPERFHKVQWMRLPSGNVTPEAQARFLKLWSHRTGVLAHQATDGAATTSEFTTLPVAASVRNSGAKTSALLAAAILGLAGGACWWLLGDPAPKPGTSAAAPAKPAEVKPAPPLSEAQQLAARALAIADKLSYTRDELAAAEDMAKRATELESGSAHAWGVRAWIHATFILRSWDRGAERRRDTEKSARRALALDPNEPEALKALAELQLVQGLPAQAEALVRQALGVRQNDRRSFYMLASAVGAQGRHEEKRAILNERIQRDPTDVLARYGLAQTYFSGSSGQPPSAAELTSGLEQIDAALAVTPFASALVVKASCLAGWKGDLTGMRAALDQLEKLPVFERSEDQPLAMTMWGALLERNPKRVLAAAALTTRPYIEYGSSPCPMAWLAAMAHLLAGRDNIARLQWQTAEAVLRERLREHPEAQFEQAQLAVTLAWLGRTDEAARLVVPIEAVARERTNWSLAHMLAIYHTALGDASRAVPYLRLMLNRSAYLTDHTLRLDPLWDKLRGQSEFEALLTDPKNAAPW